MANVGFGMLSSEIAKRKINLKKTFYEFIERTPELKMRFSDSVQTGDLEGFGLPLGSKKNMISGDHFMLTGDAASLIDPISGDGIGNAMISGKLAAEQAIRCLEDRIFTAGAMKLYETELNASIGDELRTHYNAQRMLSKMPILLDLVFLACKNPTLKEVIRRKL
jgi:flavin-dependent dehydrogenase